MKCQAYIKTAAKGRGRGATLSLVKHCLSEGRCTKEIIDGDTRLSDVAGFEMPGFLDINNPAALRDNLLRQHHGGLSKELCKHVVLSFEDVQDPEQRKLAFKLLRKVTHQFLRLYAPGCSALMFSHSDRNHPHCHILLCNGTGIRALHWSPKQLKELQGMLWLSKDLQGLVTSGRGGHRKAIHRPYPTAKLTILSELAKLSPEDLEKIPWEIRGNTRVFLYRNRRVRERTIDKERIKLYENKQPNKPNDTTTPQTRNTANMADQEPQAQAGGGGDIHPQSTGQGTPCGFEASSTIDKAKVELLTEAVSGLERLAKSTIGCNTPSIK
jgi:hypothetical protein